MGKRHTITAASTGRLINSEGRMIAAKYSEITEKKKPCSSANNLRLGHGFAFQQDNDAKHTAKTTLKWLWDSKCSSEVSECPWGIQLKPKLEPLIKTVHRCYPFTPSKHLPVQWYPIEIQLDKSRSKAKKTRRRDCCERSFYKVLNKGSEYWDFRLWFVFLKAYFSFSVRHIVYKLMVNM